ncbi:hypothetical protein [Enterobacter kobei]|uniref:hypothetical protein n=1 Tax=Enterobacter kobei TaxID=208224 RepID=UPI00207527ED|nr:hypothetical protein [Enterobacter kobei]MCM7506574.1 hypothetical protein [Enterobacter kobei]
MRVVIFQGQYGIFQTAGLNLSMPAVQSCLGLYALSEKQDYILCAHFDSALGLQKNLMDIKGALEAKGINIKGLKATVFGGDGKQSYLRCSTPSSYIGYEIVNFIKKHGGIAEYSSRFYSGIIPKTFNFHYRGGCEITEGMNPMDFSQCDKRAANIARERTRITPHEYSIAHSKMEDVTRFY